MTDTPATPGLAAFRERIGAVNDVLCAISVLVWDQSTMMPPGGADARARQIATLTGLAREALLAPETRRAIERAERETRALDEHAPDRRAVAAAADAVALLDRIPAALQIRRAELRSLANAAWIEARADSDFARFLPWLSETVDVARAVAEATGYEAHPYDAMLRLYEPGETLAGLHKLFAALRAGIAPLLDIVRSRQQPRRDFLARHFPVDAQARLARTLSARLGYDFQRGRLDATIHPFEISFTREDVRITTRYKADFLPASLFAALHETGHGIYEQNVDPAFTRSALTTDLAGLYAVGGASFGAHESQSRLYENHIGRGLPFWQLYLPLLRETFPGTLDDIDAPTFHRAVNCVAPGFIRVEADELTYDLHIMLRTDIEAGLMDGSLAARDVPEAWNAAMARDLGLAVPDAARGCLQDIHWSSGYLGSFPTYTIGNVMAAQLMATIRDDHRPVLAASEAGDHAPLREWLTANIHRHGRRFRRDELLVRATGRPLDAAPYLAHLRARVASVYGAPPA